MNRLLFAFVLLCLPGAGLAQVNTLPSAPHLLVKGHAEAHYVPDRFTVLLTVDVSNMSADVARKTVEGHMQQLFKALDDSGALKDRTHASTLAIQPKTEYQDGTEVFKGTDVSRTISATFDDIDKLRAFIARVPANKEIQINRIKTASSNINAIDAKLRQSAIENSQHAAKHIAAAYGMTITGVYSVSEVAPDFAYGIQAGDWGTPHSLDTVTVTGSVAPADVVATLSPPPIALRVGEKVMQQDIYAVYLIAPKKP